MPSKPSAKETQFAAPTSLSSMSRRSPLPSSKTPAFCPNYLIRIALWNSELLQKYTQSGGVRRLSTLIVGFDPYTVDLRDILELEGMTFFWAGSDQRVVESGGKNKEVAMMTKDDGLKQLEEAEIDTIVTEIEAEKAAAEAAKKGPPKET
ncbi:hypothetical protein Dsin_001407 [Dipteronia sinensis]|uniref:Uncharacterized protein n=1 Tax=Dipteronia sinensis TaxID=43782 RepID=A0AAE0B3T7_9ROSI|nr:hypothetical protein Dsin_001407 [Dipteronia sinensis]